MKLRHWVPFGLFEPQKPRHFREMAKVVWQNRHALGYAWRILNHGVCDGCSLGPYGLKDNVIDGTHLCLTRLKLLGLNTMRPFDLDHLPTVERLRSMTNEELHSLGRIPVPLRYRRGQKHFERISWDEALQRVGTAMQAERGRGTPERIGFFITSRGVTNETYYLSRKLASLVGTNNIDLCSRLCHAASVDGLKATLGYGAPTCSLSDLIGTDLVLIFGSNLANNQPVTMKYLHYAKKKGTRVVVVNPYREPGLDRYWVPSVTSSAIFGTQIMDDFFQVAVGGDIALISGLLKSLIESNRVAHDFIAKSTKGFDELKAEVASLSWKELEESSGLPRSQIEKLAEIYAGAKSAVLLYSMGLTQHRFGVDNVRSIVNLALIRGNVGRAKTGIMPIRGHSGVQGGGECGVEPTKLPGGVPIDAKSIAFFEREWGFPVAKTPGHRVGQMMEQAHEGKLSVLYSVGGNLFETMPDPEYMKEAIHRVPLRVHQDLVLNTSTLLEGDDVILLPAQTRYEQKGGGTTTSTERRIRFTPEIEGPQVGEARPEWRILADVGARALPEATKAFTYASVPELLEEMGRVMPVYKGIEKLSKEGDHLQWGGNLLYRNGHFDKMPEEKARFSVVPVPHVEIPKGFVYVTTRRGRQFNSMTYGSHDPLTNHQRDDVFVSSDDAKTFGIRDGDRVRLKSEVGSMEGTCRVVSIRARNVQVHWPEGNAIIPRRYDPVSGEPDYNTLARIERVSPT